MNEPIMALAGANAAGCDSETLKQFADAGFNWIVFSDVLLDKEWRGCIRRCHDVGIRVIVRWPDHGTLGFATREFAFQTYDGFTNDIPDGRVCGPSHWHPEVVKRAAPSAKSLKSMGVDGLLCSLLTCDRPYPTDWYGKPPERERTVMFWSFDEHAQKDWKSQYEAQWMPHRADKPPLQLEFLAWYQAAWLRRLHDYTAVAQSVGFENVWTWFVPLLSMKSAESIANGTADAIVPFHLCWYEPCVDAGLNPVVVTAVLLNMWPVWVKDAVEGMNQAYCNLGWRGIVGPGCNEGREVAVANLRERAPTLSAIGASGVYAGMTFLKGQDFNEAGLAARANFEEGKHGNLVE